MEWRTTEDPGNRTSNNRSGLDIPIAGFLPNSFIDWPENLAAVIFVKGCNFRCPWCQNSKLVLGEVELIPFAEVKNYLTGKGNWLDGVVITGGEPTIYPDGLKKILKEIKALGLKTKVDTNGYRPDVLEMIINDKLVDFISMDIKTALEKEKYSQACGVEVELEKIQQSIDLILNSGIAYQFRTTAVPGIVSVADVKKIRLRLKDGKNYTIQQFVPRDTLKPEFSRIQPYTEEELKLIKEVANA